MIVAQEKVTLIGLTVDEIKTVISGLETDYHEWNIKKAGVLLSQFEEIRDSMESNRNQILDDQQ